MSSDLEGVRQPLPFGQTAVTALKQILRGALALSQHLFSAWYHYRSISSGSLCYLFSPISSCIGTTVGEAAIMQSLPPHLPHEGGGDIFSRISGVIFSSPCGSQPRWHVMRSQQG